MQLYEMTALALQKVIKEKQASIPEVVQSQLKRIESTDPKIGAYISTFPEEAMAEAQKQQKILEAGGTLPLLGGLPIAIKDNICTKDMLTTCASKMLYNFCPPYDATVISKLKEAGAIIVGKTNMDEFAMGSSTEHSAFHLTKNPWDTSRVPGGSSGGSAAAVAASLAPLALGSDTGGSIRQPAAFCGVVGLKPTYGTVSRYGLIAYASSLDQIGPFAKDVADCALLYSVISGPDPKDSTSVMPKPFNQKANLEGNVKGLKIGLAKEYLANGLSFANRQALAKAQAILTEAGAEFVEVSLPLTQYNVPVYYIISCAEASSNLGRYDGIKYGFRAENAESLKDLYEKTRSQGFGAEVQRRILLGTYVLSSGYYDAYYKKALQVRTLVCQDFAAAFTKCNMLLAPTTPNAPWQFGEKSANPVDMYLEDIFTVSTNIAGLPGISVPVAQDETGLPVGLQLIGPAFGEENLFKAAYVLEQKGDRLGLLPRL